MWLTITNSLVLALLPFAAAAQTVKWDNMMPRGDYSGITHIAGDRFAVVDDKSKGDGFYIVHIDAGLGVVSDGFRPSGLPNRDSEGIALFAPDSTLFISGEADGKILEYRLDGSLTGRQLSIPEEMRGYAVNRGFEALTYNATTHRFWTIAETGTRLQSFSDDLQPAAHYLYRLDEPRTRKKGRKHVYGISEVAALDDGRVIVLERECYVPKRYIGAWAEVKLYAVRPDTAESGKPLVKTLVAQWRTKLNITARSFANYEGMCQLPHTTNASGLARLLLIADSQSRYKGVLHDWVKVVEIKQ